jgi:CHAD domain-containing protein
MPGNNVSNIKIKMATTFFILLHWKRQQRVFLQNRAKLTVQRDTKAVHDIRVATKKLRSYLKLLTILLNKTDSEMGFEKTEQLFSVLGKYRDIEMGLLLLQAFEKENKITYTAFRFHLKMALQRTEIWVQNAFTKYDEKELADLTRELQQYLKEKNNQELLDKTEVILNKEFKKLKGLAKHFNSHPHAVRKMLKNIFYWISICPKDLLLNSDQIKKLRKSLNHLGDWQDYEMLYRKIKHFRQDFIPDSREEYLLLKELEKNIENKMETKLKKAEEEIQEFISM